MDKRALFILSLFLSVTGVAYAQSKIDSLRSPSNDEPLRVLTGNIDNITTKRMNKGLLTGALDALHGQAVGVTIADPNNTEAMLHAVRVRGTTSLTGGNDPLVIIDGVYADLTTLSNVFPADIERFKILKDASETSQYGSRGASGVIVVETKKGRRGDFHISYDVTTGPELIYKQLKMLTADGYRTAVRSRGNYLVDKGFNTDFQDAITRTGFVQNHHIAFGGGTNQSNYRASLGFIQYNQVIQTIGSRNFTAKFDILQKGFDDRLQIDLGVFGNIQKNKYILDVQKLFYSAASFNPTFRRGKNPDGTWRNIPMPVKSRTHNHCSICSITRSKHSLMRTCVQPTTWVAGSNYRSSGVTRIIRWILRASTLLTYGVTGKFYAEKRARKRCWVMYL